MTEYVLGAMATFAFFLWYYERQRAYDATQIIMSSLLCAALWPLVVLTCVTLLPIVFVRGFIRAWKEARDGRRR